ncbi:MAG: nucleotidyl transferase AbiEii/AbiGii toxin family protein, partial [Deltaproteobacteria bacterium]|nr:nucleotidyl transferase AbiEii/AbiGii toxin family protein [Deltaproteobacteria bacterium]
MIPKDHITAWRTQAPWTLDAQVEQDLVISRAVVELFRVPELASSLAFRGGTALYK